MQERSSRSLQKPATAEQIEQRIYLIRGQKVMLNRDLAVLYNVPTKRLNEAVRGIGIAFLMILCSD